jgi:hypothetical protein
VSQNSPVGWLEISLILDTNDHGEEFKEGGPTSPISASTTSGLNLWSARPTCIVCVCAGADLVGLGWFDVMEDESGCLALAVTGTTWLDALSCARHGSCIKKKINDVRNHDVLDVINAMLRFIVIKKLCDRQERLRKEN